VNINKEKVWSFLLIWQYSAKISACNAVEGCNQYALFCGVPHKNACLLSDEQARQTLESCFPELLFHNKEFLK